MRKTQLAILALIFGVFFVSPLSAVGGKSALPFYGNISGVLGEFILDPEKIAERCTVPEGKIAVWAIAAFEGSGTITHMGRSEVTATHCSYVGILPDGSIGPDGTYGQGELTATAANGDILLATYDNGISYPEGPLIIFMDEFTFVDGGTGRFTFASGSGIEIGSVNFTDATFDVEISGMISYSKR